MRIVLNGSGRDVPDGTTVAAAVAAAGAGETGVAVAVNDEVVRRSEWASTALREADRVEVLTAVQGG